MNFNQMMAYSLLGRAHLTMLNSSQGWAGWQCAQPPKDSANYTSGKQMLAEALTGRTRSDAALMRQGSANASEGYAIAKSITAAAESLWKHLSDMVTNSADNI
ncbi:MAG: hypothetical protein Q4F27_01225, partial [Desulfovibrionaceae bacterium]|nr:hypothetical protein [Desulfovibrionaceae bacterium]